MAPTETIDHPYSLVRVVDETGYVSGVLPYEGDGRALAHDREHAIERVLAVLADRLAEAGFGLGDVVRTTVYLRDLGWRPALNEAYFRTFPEPRPARTCVEVSRLPADAPIELDAIVWKAG